MFPNVVLCLPGPRQQVASLSHIASWGSNERNWRKIINQTNMGSLEDHFQHLNILCLPKLYSFSVGKFMHSYHNKLLPNHLDEDFIPLSSIHYHSTTLATSRNLFSPRVVLLNFVGPKVWSSILDDIKFSTTFTFEWKLKKHLLHEKIPNFELQQHFTCPEQNTVYSSILYLFFAFSVCLLFTFRHEVQFLFSSFLLCFLLYLII